MRRVLIGGPWHDRVIDIPSNTFGYGSVEEHYKKAPSGDVLVSIRSFHYSPRWNAPQAITHPCKKKGKTPVYDLLNDVVVKVGDRVEFIRTYQYSLLTVRTMVEQGHRGIVTELLPRGRVRVALSKRDINLAILTMPDWTVEAHYLKVIK